MADDSVIDRIASATVDVIPPAVVPVSWLFVEDAAGGTITGPDDQHLKLKLNKVRKYITAFTDRPIRQADALPNADFFTAWPEMFAGDPPNAVLSYSLPSQSQPLNIVLTLTNPQYDAIKRTVSYDAVRILQATDIYLDSPDLAPFQAHKTPKRFGKATLSIFSQSIFGKKTQGMEISEELREEFTRIIAAASASKGD
jgi:hypothetical protein